MLFPLASRRGPHTLAVHAMLFPLAARRGPHTLAVHAMLFPLDVVSPRRR